MSGFVDLIVWREAASLAAGVIRAGCAIHGPGAQAATDQLMRAAEAIPANIAEGYGRGVNRDCVRYLRIARSSSTELESHLRVAVFAGRLSEAAAAPLIDQVRRVRFLINRFADSVERRSAKRSKVGTREA